MTSPPEALQQFQSDYARYLRDPAHTKRPAGVPRRQSQVYESLLFNNICGFLDRCFPVCQSVISAARWANLCRQFFRDWTCQSPYFGEIPKEFVTFLDTSDVTHNLPKWFAQLAHYEWLELVVETHPAAVTTFNDNLSTSNILNCNPTLQLGVYQWAVQTIAPSHRPRKPVDTYLIVYRNSAHDVEFMEVSALTAALIELIDQQPNRLDVTIQNLARLMGSANETQLQAFARPMILELLSRQVLWTSSENPTKGGITSPVK